MVDLFAVLIDDSQGMSLETQVFADSDRTASLDLLVQEFINEQEEGDWQIRERDSGCHPWPSVTIHDVSRPQAITHVTFQVVEFDRRVWYGVGSEGQPVCKEHLFDS